MWFRGNVQIQRGTQYMVKKIGPSNISWKQGPSPYGAALGVDPWSFVYAATRVSATGKKVDLRGMLAGGALSIAALGYLLRHTLPGGTPPQHELRLHGSFKLLKDFVGSSLKGNIGAALAYLDMQSLGYVWSGHLEDCVAVMPSGARPDFVFAKETEVCLVDAKGSACDLTALAITAKREWRRQIYPCRSSIMKSGGLPTEGRVIVSAVSSTAGLQLLTAYGRLPAPLLVAPASKPSARPSKPESVGSVQRANYIDVCLLLGLDDIADGLTRAPVEAATAKPSLRVSGDEHTIDGGAPVYLADTRLTVPGRFESWSMQPFCRVPVLRAAVRKLSGEAPDTILPVSELIRPSLPRGVEAIEGSEGSSTDVIVQGPDGAGAIFRRQ